MAQDVDEYAAGIPSDSQMLLEADTLIYDQDSNTVTAVGGVQIEYGGNRLVADNVSYDRRTQRLTATGRCADHRERRQQDLLRRDRRHR